MEHKATNESGPECKMDWQPSRLPDYKPDRLRASHVAFNDRQLLLEKWRIT